MNGKVGFGIVGCGMISYYHANAIREIGEAELVGAVSLHRSSAEKFCAETGAALYETLDALLADERTGVVCICTPSGLHKEQAVAALRAGKHVLIEKPMALTLADADEIIQAGRQAGKLVGVVSQRRFSASTQELRRAIREGAFGRIVSASLRMEYFRSQAYYDQADWRGTWAQDGGGVLMNQGIHGIDVLCYLLGRPREVKGCALTAVRKIEVEDSAAAVVRFDGPVLASITASTCAGGGYPMTLSLYGEKGRAVLEDDCIAEWDLPETCRLPVGRGQCQTTSGSDPRSMSHAGHKKQLENLIDAILRGTPLVSDGEQGRLPLEIICGIYRDAGIGAR